MAPYPRIEQDHRAQIETTLVDSTILSISLTVAVELSSPASVSTPSSDSSIPPLPSGSACDSSSSTSSSTSPSLETSSPSVIGHVFAPVQFEGPASTFLIPSQPLSSGVTPPASFLSILPTTVVAPITQPLSTPFAQVPQGSASSAIPQPQDHTDLTVLRAVARNLGGFLGLLLCFVVFSFDKRKLARLWHNRRRARDADVSNTPATSPDTRNFSTTGPLPPTPSTPSSGSPISPWREGSAPSDAVPEMSQSDTSAIYQSLCSWGEASDIEARHEEDEEFSTTDLLPPIPSTSAGSSLISTWRESSAPSEAVPLMSQSDSSAIHLILWDVDEASEAGYEEDEEEERSDDRQSLLYQPPASPQTPTTVATGRDPSVMGGASVVGLSGVMEVTGAPPPYTNANVAW
ncbi:hypothetical protein BDW22DRAFT_769938 [Trametopsis cervina]|nr:hypothetical protein BDW22DRAFT_769938 [Trametopsis cervina]